MIHLFGAFGPPLSMGPNHLVLRLATAARASAYMVVFSATVGVVSAIAVIAESRPAVGRSMRTLYNRLGSRCLAFVPAGAMI
ncbi:MAG: hypothetical protein WD894_07440 [Pirellulales bacterium]